MSTKYVKLFESWLLSEAEKQAAFDVAEPSNWPILETTIGNFRESLKNQKAAEAFLTSLFRRATNSGEWNKNAGSNWNVTWKRKAPQKTYRWGSLFFKYMKEVHNVTDNMINDNPTGYIESKSDKSIFYGVTGGYKFNFSSKELIKYTGKKDRFGNEETERIYFSDKMSEKIDGELDTSDGRVYEFNIDDVIEKLGFLKRDFENVRAKIVKENQDELRNKQYLGGRNFLKYFRGFPDYLIKKLQEDKAQFFESNKNNWEILVMDGDAQRFAVDVSGKDDTTLNPNEKKIIDFMCTGIRDLTKDEGLKFDNLNIEPNTLALGQVLAWFNKYETTGNSIPTILSNTGRDKYQGNLASLFANEEAALLPEFDQVVNIGSTEVNLANSKTRGTIVPALGLGKVLGTVGFDFNSYEISPEGRKSLESKTIWDALKKAENSIIIVGNTDSRGTKEVNQRLSELRAQAVYDFLNSSTKRRTLKKKVTITTRGDGKENLAFDDKGGRDSELAALNRRVEFIIDGQPAFKNYKNIR